MDTPKKHKVEDKHDVLQRIYWDDEFTYEDVKGACTDTFERFLSEGHCSFIRQCVNSTFYHCMDTAMDENGMEKLVAMVSGLLFEIEHNEVDPDLAYGTNWDIEDFETGNYDDLFSPEDLKLLKADIEKAKKYLSKHPEMLID